MMLAYLFGTFRVGTRVVRCGDSLNDDARPGTVEAVFPADDYRKAFVRVAWDDATTERVCCADLLFVDEVDADR